MPNDSLYQKNLEIILALQALPAEKLQFTAMTLLKNSLGDLVMRSRYLQMLSEQSDADFPLVLMDIIEFGHRQQWDFRVLLPGEQKTRTIRQTFEALELWKFLQ